MPFRDLEKRKEWRRKYNSEKVEVTCALCGKKTNVRRDSTWKYKHHFCSEECKRKFLSQMKTKEIDELQFILEYLSHKGGYQSLTRKYSIGNKRARAILEKYGIPIASASEKKKLMFANGNGRWKRAEISKCLNCSKEFKVHRGSKEFYCSRECYLSHEEKFTTIEQKVAKTLQKHGIQYIRQYNVAGLYYDFYIPEANLLIECDGDYWHGNPMFYKKLNEIQKHHHQRGELKNHIAKRFGYTLLRFWEYQINNYIKEVENEILSYIRRKDSSDRRRKESS